MRFTKMHGAGNDYVYVNGFRESIEDPSDLARRMSKAHFGVGADGLIIVLPSSCADFRMRMFNRDGSEGAMCGNGARCVGRFVYDQGLTRQTTFSLETLGGIRDITLLIDGDTPPIVCVDMGLPQALQARDGGTFVSFGSLHRVYLVDEDPFTMEDFASQTMPLCEAFDANIEYVQILSRDQLRMRVWERGSGETLACGSGACACVVALIHAGLCNPRATVTMRGGAVEVLMREEDDHVLLTGPAETVFEGEWPD